MRFKNVFFVLRHGQSEANVLGIINSYPATGTTIYHLSPMGRDQATQAGNKFVGDFLSKSNTGDLVIVNSDFTRARETAECAEAAIRKSSLSSQWNIQRLPNSRLRERYFGDWEGKSNIHYQDIWREDLINPDHSIENVETCNNCYRRVSELVQDLDRQYTDSFIILVAHGDTLQIMMTYFSNTEARLHRNIPHLETGEIRLATPEEFEAWKQRHPQ